MKHNNINNNLYNYLKKQKNELEIIKEKYDIYSGDKSDYEAMYNFYHERGIKPDKIVKYDDNIFSYIYPDGNVLYVQNKIVVIKEARKKL